MTAWLHTHLPRLRSGDPNPISVKVPGQKISYASWVSLKNVEFKVHERGRQRCLEFGVRNVHAWLVGEEILRCRARFLGEFDQVPNAYRRAVYDPWKGGAFVDAETLTAVYEAPWAVMSGKDVYYLPKES